jgi:hypothetical protein
VDLGKKTSFLNFQFEVAVLSRRNSPPARPGRVQSRERFLNLVIVIIDPNPRHLDFRVVLEIQPCLLQRGMYLRAHERLAIEVDKSPIDGGTAIDMHPRRHLDDQ